MPETPGRRYASMPNAAKYAACNERTIRRAIADGEITGYRVGRVYRIDLNELDQWMEPEPTVKKCS
jgi:excisionase family DNA binding protein